MDTYIINTEFFKLTQEDFFIRILVAIGMGFIIGLERERTTMIEKVESFAGIRTFMLTVLLGFSGGLLYFLLSPWAFVAVFFFIGVLTTISYFITAAKGDIGTTTEFSLLICFLLGTLVLLGYINISLVITVLVVVILSSKPKLHDFIGKITGEELYAFIRFVVLALLIFPFLPNQNYGPYNNLNPREIGWVIILTSGLGFLGYILMKVLGSGKGILLSGILGGLVSSTAVTWIFARKSKEHDNISHHCSVAIMAASSIMILRVLVWTFIFNKALFREIFTAILLIFVAGIGATLFFYFKNRNNQLTDHPRPPGKPLDIQGALIFGVIYSVILLVVSYANENLGQRGLWISSAIAGLSDIDAITISLSKLAGISASYSITGKAILIATLSNTLVKMGIGIWAGSPSLKKYLITGYGIIIFTAAVAWLIL